MSAAPGVTPQLVRVVAVATIHNGCGGGFRAGQHLDLPADIAAEYLQSGLVKSPDADPQPQPVAEPHMAQE